MGDMPKNALGRGLKALLPDEGFVSVSQDEEQEPPQEGGGLALCRLKKYGQIRFSLARSLMKLLLRS